MAKRYEELTISDDFIFGKTMGDKVLCHDVLERMLEKRVGVDRRTGDSGSESTSEFFKYEYTRDCRSAEFCQPVVLWKVFQALHWYVS